MPSLFPCSPVFRECLWKKIQIENIYIYIYIYVVREVENVINCWWLTYILSNKDKSFIAPYHSMHGRQQNKNIFHMTTFRKPMVKMFEIFIAKCKMFDYILLKGLKVIILLLYKNGSFIIENLEMIYN